MVLSLLGVLMLSILGTKDVCPRLSSDQAVVSAAVRYAACSKSTDAWSRGARSPHPAPRCGRLFATQRAPGQVISPIPANGA